MKTKLIATLFLAAISVGTLLSDDNYKNTDPVQFRSSETSPGVHTPHVILENGNISIGSVDFTPVIGAAAGVSLVNSTAYEKSHVIKASAGTLISLNGYNSKASAQFILIFNSASVPADGTAPSYTPIRVQPLSNFSLDVPITGIPFTTGISVCSSSTGDTKTLGSASDVWFTAVVK
jgi:hypothetical protein